MKLAKSLLLGSAAGLVAVTGAQAADLPVRAAAPVDYVRTCPNAPIGGTGFFVIPGTETCLQISGYVRTEYRFAEYVDTEADAEQDSIDFFARGSIAFDARTPTQFGTLRSFIRINGDRADDAADEGRAVLDQGFIQFAGLTAGRITSFFTFFGGNLLSVSEGLSDPSVELLAYTATFGSGFSATISVEDGKYRRTGLDERDGGTTIPDGTDLPGVGTLTGDATYGATAADRFVYGGQELPDLVANLNVTQAWGSAQIMGALHQVRHDNGANFVGVDDELGWAVGAGLNVNLPMIAAGDAIWVQAVYADGAINYADPVDTVADFEVGTSDAYLNAAGTGLVTTEAWSIAAAFRHFWTPTVWSDFQGAYGEVNVPTGARETVAVGATAESEDFFGYTWWQAGTRLNWRPVGGLTFSADVAYTQIDADRRVQVQSNGDDVAGVFTDDGSRWAGRLRIQLACTL